MPRLLIAGDVFGNFAALYKRCDTLNKSKAGPFDMILVAGAFFADDGSASIDEVVEALKAATLPTYFTDARGAPPGLLDFPQSSPASETSESPAPSQGAAAIAAASAAMDKSGGDGGDGSHKPRVLPSCAEAEHKVSWLGHGGVVMVGTLTVAFLSPGVGEQAGLKSLEVLCSKGVFMGADVLLTPEWPAGTASTLAPGDPSHSSLAELGVHLDGAGTPSAAAAAAAARPRYHFSATEGAFFQRAPYRTRPNAASAIALTRQSCVTRFIGLGAVPPPSQTAPAPKSRKWLHAVAVEPIAFMNAEALNEQPPGTTDSPFELVNSRASQVVGKGSQDLDANHLSAMRKFAASAAGGVGGGAAGGGGGEGGDERADTGVFFFGQDKRGGPKTAPPGAQPPLPPGPPPPPTQAQEKRLRAEEEQAACASNPACTTLFVSGLPQNVLDAATTLTAAASGGGGGGGEQPHGNDSPSELLRAAVAAAAPALAAALQETTVPEAAAAPPPPDDDDATKEQQQRQQQHKVAVRVPPGKGFAFLEFPSHDDAAAALAILQTVPTLGPPSAAATHHPDQEQEPGGGGGGAATTAAAGVPFHARWGKPKSEAAAAPAQKRPRFEPETRVDCWFCLASPTCETHLIASLGTDIYLTLPKGPLCVDHVLLVPISHTPSQAFLTPEARQDLTAFKVALAKYFFSTHNGSGFVVFERAADTRGTYHSHLQVVPLPGNLIGAAERRFQLAGQRCGLTATPLSAKGLGGGITAQDVGGDFFFHVEVWAPVPSPAQGGGGGGGGSFTSGGAGLHAPTSRAPATQPTASLLYRLPPGGGAAGGGGAARAGAAGAPRIPLQFGREVCADLLGTPEKSHWKACAQTTEEESNAQEKFKAAFEPFDPAFDNAP